VIDWLVRRRAWLCSLKQLTQTSAEATALRTDVHRFSSTPRWDRCS
jgi:hypothetical protein